MSELAKQEYAFKSKAHIQYRTAKGEKVPGASTIGKISEDSGALIHWSWDLGMKGIDYKKHRDELGEAGTLTHARIQADLQGLDLAPQYFEEYSRRVWKISEASFESWLAYKARRSWEPEMLEVALVSDKYKFGGTMDFFGILDGILTVADWKTSDWIFDSFRIQLAGYKILLEEAGWEVKEGLILRLDRGAGTGFTEDHIRDFTLWEKIFHYNLKIYHLKKKIRKKD